MWQKGLENQIIDLCKDLYRLIELSKRNTPKKKHCDQLQRKYFLNQKDFAYIMEEIRQRIKLNRGKLHRYNNRVNQYQQNRTFRNNEGMFCKIFNGNSNNENANSFAEENESRKFWKKIWGINKVHNKDAEWLSNTKSELLNLEQEEDIIIPKKDIRKMFQKLSHWKAHGKDE